MIDSFKTIYVEKNGLFSNSKYEITLTLLDDSIKGSAFKLHNTAGYNYKSLCVNYDSISNCEECTFRNEKALKLDIETQINHNVWVDSYVFPFESRYNISEIIASITTHKNDYEDEQAKIKELQEERLQKQIERTTTIQNFYNNVYNFHIDDNTPIYIMNKNDTNCFVIYIGTDNSINFLVIDAEMESEIHTIIEYNNIHYYEKAGEVHYATKLNVNYSGGQSFGGSFVGAKVSKGAAALGGLLLGQMGMTIGALSSYKPATYTPPTHTSGQLNISSEITKIDERSVILNYYSEQHKQFIDIELPQDIYNFLQTYLPEKKYAIVIEKEKQAAISVEQRQNAIEDTIIQLLRKLKQLYDMELITEQEYLERKKEILSEV